MAISKNPVSLGIDDPIDIKFISAERSIDISLQHYVPEDELLNVVPRAVLSTWSQSPDVELHSLQKVKTLRNVFTGKTIPAAKRYVNFVWSFDGISMQEVTHLLRYQTFDFLAQCSDTISWRSKDVLVPDAILQSSDLLDNVKENVKKSFELYAAAVDSREVSLIDARKLFPRMVSTFYWAHNNFQDSQKFINDRVSEEFQPGTDNIIAYQMACAIESAYPLASGVFDIDRVDKFYGKMLSDHGRTFVPRDKARQLISDEDYVELDFAYDKTRDEYRGTDKPEISAFEEIKQELASKLEVIREKNNEAVEAKYGISIEALDKLPALVS